MGRDTNIGWTDGTRNAWLGCSEVFEIDPLVRKKVVEKGVCRLCYLKRSNGRFLTFGLIKYLSFERVEKDLKSWPPGKVFLENYGDYLHEAVPDLTVNALMGMLERIDAYMMQKHGQTHQWQLLTKRAARMERFWKARVKATGRPIPANFWLGVSVGNKASTYYINHLKELARTCGGAFIPFVSFEPLLEDLQDPDGSYRRGIAENPKDPIWQRYASLWDRHDMLDLSLIKWIIIGGESDISAPRPMDPYWALRLIQCARNHGVPVFFKQMGGKGRDNAGGDKLFDRQYVEFPVIVAAQK